MKKISLPSVGLCLADIFVLVICFGIPVIIYTLAYILFCVYADIGLKIFIALGLVLFIIVYVMLLFSVLYMFFYACRPVSISEKGIRQSGPMGVQIKWNEITELGIAPLYTVTDPRGTRTALKENAVYIVCGEKDLRPAMFQYGVSEIWTWYFIRSNFPRLLPALSRFEKAAFRLNVGELPQPAKMIWMKYSDERYAFIREAMHGCGDNLDAGDE